jgi:hypothetical protein
VQGVAIIGNARRGTRAYQSSFDVVMIDACSAYRLFLSVRCWVRVRRVRASAAPSSRTSRIDV